MSKGGRGLRRAVARALAPRNAQPAKPAFVPNTNPGKGKVVFVPISRNGRPRAPARRPGGGGRRRNPGGFRSHSSSVPLARARTAENMGPSINGGQKTIIRHSEYLQDVPGSVGFAVKSYPINPGLVTSFPWLSNIASQYEEYNLKASYRYETDSGATTKGTVVLVTDYDALDVPFQNKQQAMDYKGATKIVPWKRGVHRVGGRAATPFNRRYVRSGAVPAGGDLKTYDVGNFMLITQGMADTTVIGELYVDYEVELVGPKVNNVLGQNLLCADVQSGGVVSNVNVFGSAPTEVPGSTINVVPNGNTFTVDQSGRFMITVTFTGTGITAANITGNGGASLVTNYANTGTTTSWTIASTVDIVANAGQGVGLACTSTTVTATRMMISQVSSGLLLAKPLIRNRRLPLLKEEDPLAVRLAQLESLVRRLGIQPDQLSSTGSSATQSLSAPVGGF